MTEKAQEKYPILSGMTDMELVKLQYVTRKVPEDKEFLYEILLELGKRAKERR